MCGCVCVFQILVLFFILIFIGFSLQEEPVEGFRVKLLNEDNLFEWEVAIFGPPDTLYQGGYFKVSL